MKIPSRELTFIKKMNVARLSTVDGEGGPHVVPVCPVVEGTSVFFATETNAKKMRNIKANDQVAIVFDEYHDSWRGLKGVMIQGPAEVVDEKTFKKIRTKLYRKYPKYKTDAALEFGESSIVEIHPKRKLAWGFE